VLRTRQAVLWLLLALLLSLVGSCGREGPDPGELTVVSTPEHAAISLNGLATGEFTPHVFADIPGGLSYRVSVALAEHATRELEVSVNYGQRATAQFTLPSIYGDLLVTSTPAGAAITLDGAATGEVTPHTFQLASGSHTVSVALAGYAAFPTEQAIDLPFEGHLEAAFNLSQQTGSLTVTSSPAGAAIWIGGTDSGQTTPHTFTGLPVGTYVVTVSLAGYAPSPSDRSVAVEEDQTATAEFALALLELPRVVLLEGFSNVYCTGCPAFSANVHSLLQGAGYGPDRVVFLKWVGDVPSPADPFYWDARLDMAARMTYYDSHGSFNHPTLFVDGSLAGGYGTPPDVVGMQTAIAAEAEDADFILEVTSPDLTGLTIDATVHLTAPQAVDLSGHVLNVVLIYEEVTTANAYQGIRVFHNVVRDHLVAVADLGNLTAGTHDFPVTLIDPDPNANPFTDLTPNGKAVVAFVQRADKLVVQAGSTMTESRAAGRSVSLVPSPASHRR
jgi:hypothetical protein